MNFHIYQINVERTIPKDNRNELLKNFVFGLIGESGEVIDALKKNIFHGHELDRDNMVKEIGDTLWYLTAIASALNITMEEVAETNIDKLKKRYPSGFSHEASVNRND